MFVETWPSINWGVVDYLRQPKAGFYALKRAYQPVLPSIEPVTPQWKSGTAATVRLWAINDTWKPCSECRLSWRITQRAKVLAKGTMTMTIPADSGTMVKTLTVTPVGQDEVSIGFTIENKAGKRVGENQRTESVIK